MKKTTLIVAALCCILAGCSPSSRKPIVTIELDGKIQPYNQYVSRVKDSTQVMKNVIDVLQNEGFMIQTAVLELGLITAKKDVDIEKSGDRTFSQFMDGQNGRWAKHRIVETTIDVTEKEGHIAIKATFYLKDIDNKGTLLRADPVDDEQVYREFFTKIDQSICQKKIGLLKEPLIP